MAQIFEGRRDPAAQIGAKAFYLVQQFSDHTKAKGWACAHLEDVEEVFDF